MAFVSHRSSRKRPHLPAALSVVAIVLWSYFFLNGLLPAGRTTPSANPWHDAPEVSMCQHVPAWALCANKPCRHGQLKDGTANISVSEPCSCEYGLQEQKREFCSLLNEEKFRTSLSFFLAGTVQLTVWRGSVALLESLLPEDRWLCPRGALLHASFLPPA